jgi:membrane fusion protein (multidrug efflux system)
MSEAPNIQEFPDIDIKPVARSRRWLRLVLLIVVPLVAAIVVLGLYLGGGRYVGTDNAYVDADKVPISAEVSGTVKEVLVRENQSVAAGQVLFRLDPAPFQVAVDRARANQAQARTTLMALKAGYREKQVEIALARTRHEFALRDQKRKADLAAKNYIAAATLDDSRLNADLTGQQITALDQDLRQIAESLGGSVNDPVESHPTYRVALAELDQAELDLARVEVRAPVAGTGQHGNGPGRQRQSAHRG